mgnify:CR=1 FL=1
MDQIGTDGVPRIFIQFCPTVSQVLIEGSQAEVDVSAFDTEATREAKIGGLRKPPSDATFDGWIPAMADFRPRSGARVGRPALDGGLVYVALPVLCRGVGCGHSRVFN